MSDSYRSILKNVLAVGIYACLVSPLFFFGKGFVHPFVTPRVFVFQAVFAVTFGAWFLLAIHDARFRPRDSLLLRVLAVYLGILLLTSLLGFDILRSIWSTHDRALGLFSLFHFAGLALVIASSQDIVPWRRVRDVFLGIGFLVALAGLLQYFDAALFFDSGDPTRPGSLFGNPIFLSSYLLFHVFFALERAFTAFREGRRGHGALWSILLLFDAAMIFRTQTRAAIIGLVAGFFGMALVAAFSKEAKPMFGRFSARTLARAALGFMFAFIALFFFTRSAPIWQNIPGVNRLTDFSSALHSVGPRLTALRISWNAFLERPVFGYGFENFKYPFDTHYEPELLQYGFTETYFDKPHNAFVEHAVSGGALGLLAYLALLAASVVTLYRSPRLRPFRAFGIGMLFAYAAMNFFAFDTFGSYLMFYLFLALLLAEGHSFGTERVSAAERVPPAPYKAIAVTAIVACGVLVLVSVNASVLVANHHAYWGLNYFVNREPDLAIRSFRRSIDVWINPYRNQIRRDYLSSLTQMYNQGIVPKDFAVVLEGAFGEVVRAIRETPRDFFLRVSIADSATEVYSFDPSYVDKAEPYLAESFAISPRRQQNFYTLSKIRFLKGDPSGAVAAMQEAVALDPDVGDPHFYYGLLAFEAGDPETGLRELLRAKALGREPKNPKEAAIAAGHYADADMLSEAIHLFRYAVDGDSPSLEWRLKLGIAYYLFGDWDSARSELRTVTEAIDIKEQDSFPTLKPIFDELGVPY